MVGKRGRQNRANRQVDDDQDGFEAMENSDMVLRDCASLLVTVYPQALDCVGTCCLG